jgi:hypothetical protein
MQQPYNSISTYWDINFKEMKAYAPRKGLYMNFYSNFTHNRKKSTSLNHPDYFSRLMDKQMMSCIL